MSISFLFLWQDSVGVDTTGFGYKIGYQIGSWLPFLIIVVLMIAIILRSSRSSVSGPNE